MYIDVLPVQLQLQLQLHPQLVVVSVCQIYD